MIKLHVKIDDSQIRNFAKQSPARADWASREAMRMTGGHYRKWLSGFIYSGGEGWKDPVERARKKGAENKPPLQGLANLVRFRVSRIRKKYFRLQIGFFHTKKRGWTKAKYKAYKQRFKESFSDLTPHTLAKAHEYGRRQRVTEKMRRRLAAIGIPLKRSTKVIINPIRAMLRPMHTKKETEMMRYFEKRFFQKFFSNQARKIGF